MNSTPAPARKALFFALTLAVVLATMSQVDSFTPRRAAQAAYSDPGATLSPYLARVKADSVVGFDPPNIRLPEAAGSDKAPDE